MDFARVFDDVRAKNSHRDEEALDGPTLLSAVTELLSGKVNNEVSDEFKADIK